MYKVTCLYNGTTYILHDPNSDELKIYNDTVVTEDNSPGSFEFTMSYDHPYLDKVVGLSSDIRVYDGDEEIFRGRPIDDGEDLYRARTFKCEGELAFLYDSIQPRRELHNVTVLQFFTLMLEEHNSQVINKGPIDKTFEVGTVTVLDSNDSLYRYTNRETTLDDIGDKLINRLGGHLKIRKSNGKRYLDYLAEIETVSDQPIQLGENLLDYAKDTDYTQIATACIPLGALQEETEIAALDAYLTIATVNNGSDTIQINNAVQNYGFICKVLHFDDITVPANLKTAGQNWLQDGQYEQMTLNLTAVDLHTLGYDLQPIRINSQIRVISTPHGMNRYFEVSKRTYHLTHPESDTVTFGKSETKKSYTSSSHNKVSAVQNHTEQIRQNIDTVIDSERANISNILNQATHGYVVLDPNSGPERILIMDANTISAARKMWKWDMNGLGYSNDGGEHWGIAITMNGAISADYITTGTLTAGIIKAGILRDTQNKNYWNMETGAFSLSATTTVGGKTVSTIASDAVDAQTQTDIFNKLTNNGQAMGIYLNPNDNRLYINASYINAGTINANLIKAGVIQDSEGHTSFNMATGCIAINNYNNYHTEIWTSGITMYSPTDEVLTSMYTSTGGLGIVTANRMLIGPRDSENIRLGVDSNNKGFIEMDNILLGTNSAGNGLFRIDSAKFGTDSNNYSYIDLGRVRLGTGNNGKGYIEVDGQKFEKGTITINGINVVMLVSV